LTIEVSSNDRIFKNTVLHSLTGLGYEVSDNTEFRGKMGRNISGTVHFTDTTIFVKNIRGMDGHGRFDRSRAFDTCGIKPSSPFNTPKLLHADRDSLTVIHEFIDDADSLGESFLSGEVTDGRLADIAATLAAFHCSYPKDVEQAQRTPPPIPPWGRNAVHIEVVEGATSGYLDVWRIIQGDNELRVALQRLVTGEYDPRPIHGDLRMDQFLAAGSTIWMIDWEEFRLGDPARDIGSLAGELLYSRMRRLTERTDNSSAPLTESDILRNGAELIDLAKKDISLLWKSYVHNTTTMDEHLATRSAKYIGWQLFDRALATGSYFGRISASDRAIAGIGRSLILHGAAYLSVVGLGEEAS
jgi:thiamine kinase-like enzyme